MSDAVYLKLFVDCLEKYQKLNDTEFGRLVRAALRYKATGAEPDELGREALLWDGMRLDIDRDNESYSSKCSARAAAGKKGAQARWQGHNDDSKNGKCHLPCSKNGQEKDKHKDKDQEHDKPLRGNSARSAQEPPRVSDCGFSPELEAAVNDWLAYKQERREAYKPVGLKALLTQIKNAASANGDAAVAAVIRQSMSSGYKGIVFDRLERAASKPKPNSKPAMECSFAQPTGQDVERMKRLYDKLKGADDDGEF